MANQLPSPTQSMIIADTLNQLLDRHGEQEVSAMLALLLRIRAGDVVGALAEAGR